VLSSSPEFNPSLLAKFGREVASPLEIEKTTAADKHGSPPAPLGASAVGFIDIDSQDVVLSTWKAAENGDGYILRFYNTTERPVTARVRFPEMRFETVYHVNAVEVNQEPLTGQQAAISLAVRAHEIYSLRITGFKLK
jgi:alpha-mannosidase